MAPKESRGRESGKYKWVKGKKNKKEKKIKQLYIAFKFLEVVVVT